MLYSLVVLFINEFCSTINTPKSADEIKPMLNGYQGKVYTVDARKISVQALGKYFPNSPMLAVAVAVSGIMKKDAFISEMRASYQHKFAKKPEEHREDLNIYLNLEMNI
ncbi:2-oxoacid:acceptor oxidoreductase family protein [Anaerostipes sp.]|uniref:2-oxoacid:acceptor oxidoreductase family protein n=1 Tax=Anaerostipes sp. TaxID=1872530 RepID=UPI002F3FB1C2